MTVWMLHDTCDPPPRRPSAPSQVRLHVTVACDSSRLQQVAKFGMLLIYAGILTVPLIGGAGVGTGEAFEFVEAGVAVAGGQAALVGDGGQIVLRVVVVGGDVAERIGAGLEVALAVVAVLG